MKSRKYIPLVGLCIFAIYCVSCDNSADSGGLNGDTEHSDTTTDVVIDLHRPNDGGKLDWTYGGDGEGYGIDSFPDGTVVIAASRVGQAVIEKLNAAGESIWAANLASTSRSSAEAVSVLADGSFIVVGMFGDSFTLGVGEVNETTLTAGESFDSFIARYNSDGTLAWAKAGGATYWGEATSVYGFEDGTGIVAGWYEGTQVFGRGESNEETHTSLMIPDSISGGTKPDREMYIAKYDGNGNFLWVITGRYPSGDMDYFYPSAAGVTGFPDQSFAVTGHYNFEMEISGHNVSENISLRESSGMFVARFNGEGFLQWFKYTTDDLDILTSCTAEDIDGFADGSLIVTGEYSEAVIFGAAEANETKLTAIDSVYDSDFFIARYNQDGTLAWAKSAGGVDDQYVEQSSAVTSFKDGYAAITGRTFYDTVFNLGQSDETTLTVSQNGIFFLALYRPDGTVQWARKADAADQCWGRDITDLDDGSAAVIGLADGACTFGPGEANQTTIQDPLFVARFTP